MEENLLFVKSERLRMPTITAALATVAMTLGVIRLIVDGYFSDAVGVQIVSSILLAMSSFLFRTKHSRAGVHLFLATGSLSSIAMVLLDGVSGHVMVWLPFVPFLVALIASYMISFWYTAAILMGIAFVAQTSNEPIFDYFSLAGAIIFSCGLGVFLEQVRMRYERTISEMATRHVLTGLPSRVVFDLLLERAAEAAGREMVPYTVAFIDVDRLKMVNDTYGHQAGDALLKEVGQRLSSCLESCEKLFHISGDEFVVLAEGPVDLENLKKRFRSIGGDFSYMGFRLPLGVSVGAAAGTANAETSLLSADSDMYHDKRSNTPA